MYMYIHMLRYFLNTKNYVYNISKLNIYDIIA